MSEGQLEERLKFFNENFFSSKSHYEGKKGKRRVYIAFAEPVHATMKRLNDTNEELSNVLVIAIPLIDEITHPPEKAPFQRRTKEAYEAFANKLIPCFPFNF